jgi:hypothetical protein
VDTVYRVGQKLLYVVEEAHNYTLIEKVHTGSHFNQGIFVRLSDLTRKQTAVAQTSCTNALLRNCESNVTFALP